MCQTPRVSEFEAYRPGACNNLKTEQTKIKLKSHINSYIPFINWCHLIAPQGFTDLLGNQEETNLQLTDYFLKKYLHSCILINCKLQCITTVS